MSNVFIDIKQVSQETGLPRKRVYNDIKSGALPAVKRGNKYYIYEGDYSKYVYKMVCDARGVDADKAYKLLAEPSTEDMLKAILKGLDSSDKPKD